MINQPSIIAIAPDGEASTFNARDDKDPMKKRRKRPTRWEERDEQGRQL
jgi:hypothetical protein